MKRFNSDIKENPSFNTVNGLSNKTFDPENIVSGRGATEDQLKVVGDVVKDLNDYIDESGCSDCNEKYQSLEQTLTNLEMQQEECCQNRVTQENLDALLQALSSRLDDLENQIEICCNKNDPGGGTLTCDGNTITVSYSWNGADPLSDGGQAIAVSADPSRNIVAFFFLVYDAKTGMYYKRTNARGFSNLAGGWEWTINSSGEMTASYISETTGYLAHAIVAVDENGCEGMVLISLPTGDAPVGG